MNEKKKPILGQEAVTDARTLGTPRMLILGLQHLFAMFGATVLVPILVQGYGLPLSIQTTLLMAGLGTLLFHVCTKFKVPAFLGSSFAYLGGWFTGWSPARFGAELYGAAYNGFYANTIMVAAYYTFVVVTLALGFALDARRAFTYKNKPSEICLANEKHRWGIYYVLVICLLVGYIMQNGGFGGASGFGMYANF